MSTHIEWKEVCVKALLAEGKIDEGGVNVLKKELKSSTTGNWYQEGVKFLVDLREAYTKKAKAKKEELGEPFEKFFLKVVQEYVLKDGAISEHEATWLRETLFADGKIDDREWELLQNLNKKAKEKSDGFNQLFLDCQKKHAKGAAAKGPKTEPKG